MRSIEPIEPLFAGLETMQAHGIPRVMTERLRARFPDRYMLITIDGLFRVDAWAHSGAGTREPLADQVVVDLIGGHPGEWYIARHSGCERVRWNEHQIEIVTISLPSAFDRSESWHWVLAPSRDIANSFYLAVAEWNRHVHGEILVFEAGCFSKSKELQDDIASFSVDDLVLAGDLGSALRLDLKRFLESKATYARAKVPWKRGLLFLGPPGNGKTHAVKGLLRESGLPCIYVKSFSGRRVDPHDTIPKVFERARDLAPCVLVLEDLDALIDDENRSLILNEPVQLRVARTRGAPSLPGTVGARARPVDAPRSRGARPGRRGDEGLHLRLSQGSDAVGARAVGCRPHRPIDGRGARQRHREPGERDRLVASGRTATTEAARRPSLGPLLS
jgi:hypothetical protein